MDFINHLATMHAIWHQLPLHLKGPEMLLMHQKVADAPAMHRLCFETKALFRQAKRSGNLKSGLLVNCFSYVSTGVRKSRVCSHGTTFTIETNWEVSQTKNIWILQIRPFKSHAQFRWENIWILNIWI